MQIQVTKLQESGEHHVTIQTDQSEAELPLDEAYEELALSNRAPPHFVKPLRGQTRLEGESVCLEAQIIGSQPITVQWLLDGEEIHNGSLYEIVSDHGNGHHFVNIIQVYLEDEGTYVCTASNAFGVATSSAILTVIKGVW